MKIVFDTNFCMVPFEFKVDIIDELNRIMPEKYEVLIPNLVVDELNKIARGIGKRAIAARSALEFVKNFKKVNVEKRGSVDKSIIYFAKENNCILATQDKEMKRIARSLGVPTITMRQKKYLIYDGS